MIKDTKMLSLFLLCIFSVAFTSAKPTIPLSADVAVLLLEKSVGCIGETGADANILQRVFNWHFDDNDTSKKFAFCLFNKSGYCDETGHFDTDKIMTLFEKSDKKELVKEAADYCEKIRDKTPLDTMYREIICFFERSPVLLRVL